MVVDGQTRRSSLLVVDASILHGQPKSPWPTQIAPVAGQRAQPFIDQATSCGISPQ